MMFLKERQVPATFLNFGEEELARSLPQYDDDDWDDDDDDDDDDD